MRIVLVASAAFAFVVGAASSADAQYRRYGYWPSGYTYFGGYAPEPYVRRGFKKKRTVARPSADQPAAVGSVKKANPERDGFADFPKGGVLQIAISINSQRLSLYRDGVRVAQSPVSTGTASHPTPTGVFSVIEKDRWHRSNLYGNAPMWFMQRVTWSGVAMHEGILPGHAASHGCIRLPREFAARLWPTTKLGARVVIARGEVAPVDFKHAKLFTPAPKPAEPKVAMIAPADAAAAVRPVRLAEAGTIANDAPVPAAAKPAAIEADDAKPSDVKPIDANAAKPSDVKPAAAGAEDGKPADTAAAMSGEDVKPADTAAAPADATPAAGGSAEATTAAPTVPADTINATGAIVTAPAEATAPVEANDLRKAVEAPQSGEPSAPVQAAPAIPAPAPMPAAAPAGDDPVKAAPAVTDPLKPTAPRTRAADQPAKRSGQVAVFVSRKEKKIFVRQGFIPVFDMPITIENPDQPLGTHVFTALGLTDDGAGMRWNLITMPTGFTEPRPERTRKADGRRKAREVPVVDTRTPSTAAEALDRIQMPPEAVERISELLIPGSSLVVSDEGLGKETGRYTEFIVLTR